MWTVSCHWHLEMQRVLHEGNWIVVIVHCKCGVSHPHICWSSPQISEFCYSFVWLLPGDCHRQLCVPYTVHCTLFAVDLFVGLFVCCWMSVLLLQMVFLLVFSVSSVHLNVKILNIISGFGIICRQNAYVHNHNYIIVIVSLKYFCDFMDSYLHSSKYVLIVRYVHFQLSWWSYWQYTSACQPVMSATCCVLCLAWYKVTVATTRGHGLNVGCAVLASLLVEKFLITIVKATGSDAGRTVLLFLCRLRCLAKLFGLR
jgi:hypothetical protein